MLKIGIPRALFYYQYFPAWKAFFEALGAETVVSPPSNRATFLAGNARAVAETCLPVKLFFGHVTYIMDKCDYIFIPAMRSLGRKAYYCSKFIGLPDMTRALVPECPPILDPEIDLNKDRRSLLQQIYGLGRHFNQDKSKIKKAMQQAWQVSLNYRRKTADERITTLQALFDIYHLDERCPEPWQTEAVSLDIAVIGHQYVIHDDYINHRLIARLQAMGARVFTPEMVHPEALDNAMQKLVATPHWSFEADIVGAGAYYLESKVDGIISVAVFGCGPDSMMISMVAHQARKLKVPFLHLSLDEHTSEGGLVTRLEAFLDMVKRRKKICV